MQERPCHGRGTLDHRHQKRVWEGTEAKDTAIREWCRLITEQTGKQWQFARVNQSMFQASKRQTLAEVIQPADPRKVL
jgi:hypothetical protein